MCVYKKCTALVSLPITGSTENGQKGTVYFIFASLKSNLLHVLHCLQIFSIATFSKYVHRKVHSWIQLQKIERNETNESTKENTFK